MKIHNIINESQIASEHVKGGLDSYYQLTKAKRLAKADGHDYDKLPEYDRGKDQPHKEKYMALAKEVNEMDQDEVDLGPTWKDDLEAALDRYPESQHDTIKDGMCPECGGNGYMDGDYENEDGEENDECNGMYDYDCDEGEIRDNTWADELKSKEPQAPKQPAPSKEQIMKILPRLHDDYVKTGRYNAFELGGILKQMYPELNKREAGAYVADFLSNFKESEELNDLRKRAGLEEVSDFKRRELEYELRDEEPNRDSKKRRPYRTPQEKIRDAKKRYSKAVGVMKGNTDEGIEEAEGDKCEICNGRGKIDYHSEDGPSKCQKCNGKGVQAWKPEPVNWGNAKVKEDDLNDLRKRAGLEVRAVSEESLHEESFDCDDKFFETYGWLDADTLEEAEYQGRKVKLNKPMQGDVKKFKVYVKDPKTGNTKKVNFGHGGSSVKGKAMKIRKNNPKARKSFRARHNCDSPGPKTKARYWSCRKW